MSSAPYHTDHAAIRETLYSLNILDTPLEERFQRITRMVCVALGVPISAFSLIDGERQWFKSIQGLDATENTRAESFCAYTILSDDIMVIPDTRKDARFSGNPLVKNDPNITFYAGCPIRAPDGRNIGSLCAIDTKVRNLTADQLQVMKDLSAMLESELKAAQLSEAQRDIINDLNATQRLLLIDPVTRLWNKNGLEDILKRERHLSSSRQSSLSFLLIEITNANDITGRYGRAATEGLIKTLAKRLLQAVRSEDSIGRLDGDRFGIVLTSSDVSDAKTKALEICRQVSAQPFSYDTTGINFILNFGVASDLGQTDIHFDTIIAQAEKNL